MVKQAVDRLIRSQHLSRKTVHLSSDGIRRGAIRLLPIAAFTIPFGIAFGVASIDAGVTMSQAIAMSVFTFSGAAQFAVLDFWTSPVAFASLGMVVLALNARLVIMGAVVSPSVNRLPVWRRCLTLAFLSDPNFADSQSAFKDGEQDVGVLLGGGLALWSAWVIGTVIGVGGGRALGRPELFGIDVVMVCFFVAVVVGKVRGAGVYVMPIITASVVSVLTLNWLPIGWNVILGAFAGAFVGLARRAA